MYDKKTVIEAFYNLSRFADTDVHPIVSPDNWDVYSQLRDMIDLTEKATLVLLNEQEAKILQLGLALDIAKGTCKGIKVERQ